MAQDIDTSNQEGTVSLLEPQPYDTSSKGLAVGGLSTAVSAPVAASTNSLFHGGSDNILSHSTANLATRDVWNVGSVHVHIPQAESQAREPPSPLPQLLRQPLSVFSYILSAFITSPSRTAVTLGSSQEGAPSTATPAHSPAAIPDLTAVHLPDLNVAGSERENAQHAEASPFQDAKGVATETGSIEIAFLEDLDMDARHQPRAFYRSSDLPDGLSFDGIYIKKIYPNGHGYPCPNPCPEGPPVRIGDIGELTSTGFTALANLADCQLPSLQRQLESLVLSDPWCKPDYFSEGQSITGGVSVEKIKWESETIQDIKYRCQAPQGAILAVTSPAQLHTLTRDRNRRLRAWLCEYGMDLVQHVDPGRTEPLYIVTGKVTSSSWATATYSEPMAPPADALVLTRFSQGLPSYRWTEPGNARNWSQSSSTINAQGERASDQCLFLRGFLLTPSPNRTRGEEHRALKVSHSAHGTSDSHINVDTAGGVSGEGSSQSTHWYRHSSRSGASRDVTMGERSGGVERDDLLVEEIPSLSSVDFYPSHRINRRLLELTNANLAITHDDDWISSLEGHNNNKPDAGPSTVSITPVELRRGRPNGSKNRMGGVVIASPGITPEPDAGPSTAPITPVKHGRGRPKGSKNKTGGTAVTSPGIPIPRKRERPPKENKDEEEPRPKRRRSRPPKSPRPEVSSSTAAAEASGSGNPRKQERATSQ